MPGKDIRRVLGEKVYAKAVHVTSLVECSWRYGSILKTKEVCVMVLEVATKKKSLNHNSYLILAEYNLGGGKKKRKEMIISSVLKVAPPPPRIGQKIDRNPRFQYWTHWRRNTGKTIPGWHNNNRPEISDRYCGGYRLLWVRKHTWCGNSTGGGRTKIPKILLLMTMAPVFRLLSILLLTTTEKVSRILKTLLPMKMV